MNGLTAWFTKNPVAANLLALLVICAGLFTMMEMRIEGFPKIPPSYITVNISYPNSTAEQVDSGLSRKVEKALEGVAGIKKVVSISMEDSSEVLIQKETGYDMLRLLNDVKTKVEGIGNMPERAEKPIINIDEFRDFALITQLYGDVDEETLQKAGRIFEKELLSNPKISKIEVFGKKESEIRIEVKQDMLSAYGLSMEDIKEVINSSNVQHGFGSIKSEEGYISLRADNKLHDYKKLVELPLFTFEDGSRVFLRDIASIISGYKDSESSAMFQGKSSIGIIIYTSSKGDIMEVSRSARKVAESVSRELPASIGVDIWADYSIYMKDRIMLLQSNAWQGLIIVFVILAIFLNFKLAFWVAMGIPFSIAGAFVVMGDRFLGYSINDITTFGLIIVLGILVDDAVVVGESVYEERLKVPDPIKGTVGGVHKVALATVFGMSTTIAAFYPLMLIQNDLGRILASFSGVVIAALVFSLVESKLVLPAHLASVSVAPSASKNILSKGYAYIQSKASSGLQFFNDKVYRPTLKLTLKYRYSALVLFITFAIFGFWLMRMGYVRTVFFPDIPSDVITVQLNMENGSSDKMTYRNAAILDKAAAVANEKLKKKYGVSEPPVRKMMTHVVGGYSVEIYAELQPQKIRVVPTKELLKVWREGVKGIEGDENLLFSWNTETGGGFKLNVESRNSDSLDIAVKRLEDALRNIEGVSDVRDDLKSGEPEIRLKLKAEAEHLGVTPAELASFVDSAYGGYELDRFNKGSDEIKLKMIYEKRDRESIYQLMESKFKLKDGSFVPLSAIADMNSVYSAGYIRRENGKRAIEVKASLDKDITSADDVLNQLDVIKEIESSMPDVRISMGGELEEEGEMKGGLRGAFIMIMLLIYALLAIPLKSYWKPLVIMSVIPFGLTGAIAGHLIMGLPVSLLSFFGMLALTGIVVNDSLVMLTRFNDLLDDGMDVSDALESAGVSRFRAIFLTTATTVCGLIPLMSETSEQAQYLIPAAVSLAFGEMFATLITLLLVPLLMNIAYDIRGGLTK